MLKIIPLELILKEHVVKVIYDSVKAFVVWKCILAMYYVPPQISEPLFLTTWKHQYKN